MIAEIIAIGSELTCGSKLDTNSQWLSRELESLGWTVTRHTTLADDLDAMVREFQQAASRAQVILITGGLGPTLDDITRDALAQAFGQKLIRDPESVRHIQALFLARGREMPERNHRQADRPEHSAVLPNSCGTAPGILMKVTVGDRVNFGAEIGTQSADCLIAVMPGVPAEMKPMFENHVRPQLPSSGMFLRRTAIRSFGFGESDAERMLGELTERGRNPEVGITASEAVISLWVSARSPSMKEADRLCDEACDLIRERLGEAVYATGDEELHDVLAGMLRCQCRSVALVEGSTTGGQMAMWMSENATVASVVKSAIAVPESLNSTMCRAMGIEPPVDDADWWNVAETIAEKTRLIHQVDFVLLSSPFHDELLDSGVVVRRGYVAVKTANDFTTIDVSMSGNLAIFRQRAARTAMNRLRLLIQNEVPTFEAKINE
ncbi:MAG TPA: molybdopterin-binding protein [Planctomycetaceae bacterium]|nr:molybdopterin-binding protein [Planctomycetaceae bacterium]